MCWSSLCSKWDYWSKKINHLLITSVCGGGWQLLFGLFWFCDATANDDDSWDMDEPSRGRKVELELESRMSMNGSRSQFNVVKPPAALRMLVRLPLVGWSRLTSTPLTASFRGVRPSGGRWFSVPAIKWSRSRSWSFFIRRRIVSKSRFFQFHTSRSVGELRRFPFACLAWINMPYLIGNAYNGQGHFRM